MLFHQRATPEEEEGGRGPGRDAQSPNWLEQTSIAGVHSSVQLNFNYNYILYIVKESICHLSSGQRRKYYYF